MAGKGKGKGGKGKSKGRRGGLPKSLIKKHHGNLKAAWAEHRGGRAKTKSPSKAGKTAKKGGKGKSKGKSKGKGKGKGGSHSHSRSSSRNNRSSRSTIIRTNRTQSIAVVPIPSPARHGTAKRKSGGKKKGGSRKAKEGYMMENPLGGGELLVGGVTALLGFVIYDGVDRVLATHALTDSGSKDSAGNETYTDTPPTSGTYSGLFNATAVMAPMSGLRWAVGGISTLAFLGLGQVIKNNMGRSALQCFGFGIGIRFLGKALVDLVASLSMKTGYGQRLYDGEMRANSLSKGTSGYPLTSLPSTGLGATGQIGVGSCCGNCSAGLPCCRGASGGYSAPPPPPPGGNQPQPGPNPPSTQTQPPSDGGGPRNGTGVQNPGGYVMGHTTGPAPSVGTQGLGFRPRSGFIPPAPHIRAMAH